MGLEQLNTYLLGSRKRGFMELGKNESEIPIGIWVRDLYFSLPVNFEENRR